jgi:hypothetical protein
MSGHADGVNPPFILILLAVVAILIVEPLVADRVGGALAVRLSAMGLTVPLVVVGLLEYRTRPRWWLLGTMALVVLLNGGGMARLAYLPPQVGLAAALALLVWATLHVFRRVLRASAITPRVVAGALSAYLMIALTWALAYGAVEVTWPGSIHVTPGDAGTAPVDVHTLMYFSGVTIMTIGYGDVTPAVPFTRTLAVLEGLTGIVFTTVVLGALVGTLVQSGRRQRTGRSG